MTILSSSFAHARDDEDLRGEIRDAQRAGWCDQSIIEALIETREWSAELRAIMAVAFASNPDYQEAASSWAEVSGAGWDLSELDTNAASSIGYLADASWREGEVEGGANALWLWAVAGPGWRSQAQACERLSDDYSAFHYAIEKDD